MCVMHVCMRVCMCVDTHVLVYYTCGSGDSESGSHAYIIRTLITGLFLTHVVFSECKSSEHVWQIRI